MASEDQEIDQILEDVTYLRDRQDIQDVIYRYSRGVDRHDEDIIASVFHPDAIDNHGIFVGTVPEFVKWVNSRHEAGYRIHTHHITSHNCWLDGDVAHTESYVMFCLQLKNEESLNYGSARYIDRLEKRNGEWRIALRRVVIDWRFQVSTKIDPNLWAVDSRGFPPGTWDKTDLSYMRPLALTPAQQKEYDAKMAARK